MALIDQYNETQTAQFVQRVQMAMCAAAINIQSETPVVLLKSDAAAAQGTVTPVSVAGFSTGDLIQIGTGANAETRSITVSGANFTVSNLTNLHHAGEVIQKVIYNHTNRANYAKLILNNPAQYAILFVNAICANDANLTVENDGTTTDSTINTDVASVFNALAGTV